MIEDEKRSVKTGRMDWVSYHRHDEVSGFVLKRSLFCTVAYKLNFNTQINEWTKAVAAEHSSIAEVFILGRSYEDREILGLKISKSGEGETKPAIFIDASMSF